MVTKRETKAAKRGKRVKDLRAKNTTVRQAKGVRGGAVKTINWGDGMSNTARR
jgi:hypothetical protein